LINCEYFNNLNENEDMAGTCIMTGICTFPYPSPYPTEKVGDSPYPYPYPYPVNAGIPRQNGDGFRQYPRGRVYLPSLHTHVYESIFLFFIFTYMIDIGNKIIVVVVDFSLVHRYSLKNTFFTSI